MPFLWILKLFNLKVAYLKSVQEKLDAGQDENAD